MKKLLIIFLLIIFGQALFAQNSVNVSNELSIQATSNIEAMLGFTSRIRFPAMQGSSLLTRDNNITLEIGAEVAPISAGIKPNLIITPIAFLELNAGGYIGSGWNLSIFDDDIYGIGFNRPTVFSGSRYSGSAFDGIHYRGFGGVALQADLAALLPGAWNHVVFRTYHEMSYRGYSRADHAQQSWYYLNNGENRNSFYYLGNYILGYQMPIFLSMIAFVAEAERDLYLDGAPTPDLWGYDIFYWVYSAMLNFSVTRQFDIALIAQFHTQKNYVGPSSVWEEQFYQFRVVNNSNPTSLEFHRIVLSLSFKF